MIRETLDAFVGLEDATPEEWSRWHAEMLELRVRANVDTALYEDASTAWSDETFRQYFLFMFDASFFANGQYRTAEMIDELVARFGRIDEIVMWHAYPRLGFDARTQFDFYRQMPGGLARLRTDVTDVLHARGVRVVVDYNPWDAGSEDELAEIVHALDADAVMLDTMTDVPSRLVGAVTAKKTGVVFMPELRMKTAELALARQSWAQFCEMGEGPSIHRNRWLAPRHRQFVIARWDTSRKNDVVRSFFEGSGLVIWENVFGSYNAYSRGDRRLIAETGAVFDRYGDVFARGTFSPLVPTGVSGLDANRFVHGARSITAFRNRTDRPLAFVAREACFAFWGKRREIAPGEIVIVEPRGTQALVVDEAACARAALDHFDRVSRIADVELPRVETRRIAPSRRVTGPSTSRAKMIEIPGGAFHMHVAHSRRECGCWDHPWGSPHTEIITHDVDVTLAPYAIRAGLVTNAEFLAFVRASGYRPADPERFLVGADDAPPDAPVTHVSLADARAFAAFEGHRLPTEAEWQRAGIATPLWELTESEWTDGHTRFVMLRGGSPLAAIESEWHAPRGPQPLDSHAKYILLADGLDRSETISFRTVAKNVD
ncbi:MAG TPA: formylglycine-generating enzyme family protein [Polyangiaceae bacterium]|jgi:hypothetical protein|nr:formylglycine-generating enzyme family protein [Polyangiaceae bacterium]